jgi:tRNA pseudouridine55 synthase
MAKRAVDGILLLDKPLEISSNGILQRVRWLFQAEKAGHTGALDPLASGLLPLCFGEATKFSQFLLDTDKTYEVTARFGQRTDTSDAAGELISERPITFDLAMLDAAVAAMTGPQLQIPTMFSALKYQGQPLYKYARQGITVPREARPINIFRFERLDFDGTSARFIVHCSKGTYIRTLIDDLGERLGCGSFVSALRRVHVGPFHASQMIALPQLDALHARVESVGYDELDALLLPMDFALQGLAAVTTTALQQQRLSQGQTATATELQLQVLANYTASHCAASDASLPVDASSSPSALAQPELPELIVRLYNEAAQFYGIASFDGGQFTVKRLLNTSRFN